jgi:hypothetical protein
VQDNLRKLRAAAAAMEEEEEEEEEEEGTRRDRVDSYGNNGRKSSRLEYDNGARLFHGQYGARGELPCHGLGNI